MNKSTIVQHSPLFFIALISVSIALIGNEANLAMRFDREAILTFEWWRLLTGNLAHLSWNHLWMNLAGLIMIWFMYHNQLTRATWFLNFILCSLSVSICLLILNPELNWYVGLSGTLHGLLMTGIIINVLKKERLDIILFIFVSGKLIWEQYSGALPGSAETAGGPVIVDAHLYGAIGGLLTGYFYFHLKRYKNSEIT